MNYKLIFLLACLSFSVAHADKPKKKKKAEILELKETIQNINERIPIPPFLRNNEKANDYAAGILYLSDEQYTADTTEVGNCLRSTENLISQYQRLTPRDAEKYELVGWDVFLHERLHDIAMRYDVLHTYCEKQRKAMQRARQQTMPKGRLLEFSYEEWGSSRPNPVNIAIKPDNDGRQYVIVSNRRFYDEQDNNNQKVLATEAILQEFRQRIEAAKVFQLLPNYSLAALYRDVPLPLGGPPSWHFSATFEGGSISTGGECGPREVCAEIVQWLVKKIKD